MLKEELLDLSAQSAEEVALLRYTPAAGSIGTCRYKLKPSQTEDFDRVIEVFKAHDVGYFLYIGGNDSMDTANKVAELARERGLDLVGVGVPKTIDNDVGDSEFKLIDHTPGYGSVAKYWMHMVQNANEENAGSSPGRSGAGDAGDGPQDRLHPGRGPAGRSEPRDAAADLPGRKPLLAGSSWPTRSTISCAAIGPLPRGRQRRLRRRRARRGEGLLRPHVVQRQPDRRSPRPWSTT